MKEVSLSRREWLKTATVLGATAAGSTVCPRWARGDNARSEVADIGSRRELFIDDFLIELLGDGAQQRLHHPLAGEVAMVFDKPWEGSGSGYHTVFQDGDRYRMYYRGSHLDVSPGKLGSGRHKPYYCYAESKDAVHWQRPELGIIEFEGSRRNNIVLEGLGTHNFAPFQDDRPDCPSEARYKALGGLKNEGGLFAFQSPDGVHWSLMRKEPVITNGAFDSQNIAFWDATIGRYRAYWRTFTEGTTTKEVWKPEGYRAIRTGMSDNFLEWGEEADLSYTDSPDEHLYTNQIKPYHRAPHILIGFPTRYLDRGWSESMRALPERENRELRASSSQRYGTALTEGLLMASRDGRRFKRWNEAFLRPGIGRPGTWQYGQQYIAWHAVETASAYPGAPNELSLYATEGYWHGAGGTLRRSTLRLDGFVSISAPRSGGQLLTRPLTFSGRKLDVNFATSAAGNLGVEFQDLDGKPLDGFSLADCHDHFGDTIQRTIHWNNGCDVSSLSGRSLRVKFHLHDANLYSFQFLG